MQLVADRFALHEDGRALDLATGAPVRLIVGTAAGVSEQVRWSERCATLRALRHQSVAKLVDFGLVGESLRFEAWNCGAAARAGDRESSVHACAVRWLRACALSVAPSSPGAVHVATGSRWVWVPDPGSGYPSMLDTGADELPIAQCGIRIINHPAIIALTEMFQASHDARPQVSSIWGPPGSGRRVVVGELARVARMHGFVPVAARLIGSRHAELWCGRSLFVIADASDRSWPAFLEAA